MEAKMFDDMPVPLASDWAKLHSLLLEEWSMKDDEQIPKPPVPLILAGAAFSSASAIRQRWIDLILWANEYGFAAIVRENLSESPNYDVAERLAGVSEDGKGWWSEFGEQVHKAKAKPSKKTVLNTLKKLKQEWKEIIGTDLARATIPRKFTGRKARCLVVFADPEFSPTWGSWYSTSQNSRAFTEFRKAINDAISPMEVDHVVFRTENWKNENSRIHN